MKGVSYKVQVRRNAISIHMHHTFMGIDKRLQKVRSCRTGKGVKMSIDKEKCTSEATSFMQDGSKGSHL